MTHNSFLPAPATSATAADLPREVPAVRQRMLTWLFGATVAAVAAFNLQADESAPKSWADELATFRFADPQLVAELVAAEPDVDSPVACCWDADGALYVAEMSDYPGGKPSGRVRRLEDRDGDGRFERVTIFADDLPLANGVLPWNGGILATSAPNIWFLKDTDGDGQADSRRIVLTGFVAGNPQLLVNGLVWGLDNRVYGANGRSDGQVRGPDEPDDQAVSIRRRDFRFRPDNGKIEAVAGFSQFGLARDDWGRRFPSWNTIPLRHVVLEDRYLNRNPYLASAAGVGQILESNDAGRLYPISAPVRRFNRESVQFFNASCGPAILRGDLLGETYRGDAFICEPLTNLVHRRVLKPSGATFTALRAEVGREFLASSDAWFHPVNLATGPDGGLYVVDFYREWVEHPQWVPEKLRTAVDWRKGAGHGRIWRIRHMDRQVTPAPQLTAASSAALVETLASSNGWRRDTAQRLLVERADRDSVPLLRATIRKSDSSRARVHALWTLDGLASLDDESIRHALADAEARVREQALLLCENRAPEAGLTLEPLLALVQDPDARVRMQLAAVLGGIRRPDALTGLIRLASRDAESYWTRLAVLSGLAESAQPFLDELLDGTPGWLETPISGEAQLISQTAAIIGVRSRPGEIAKLLERTTSGVRQEGHGRIALIAGLAEGLAETTRPLHLWLAEPSNEIRETVHRLGPILRQAGDFARSETEGVGNRVAALRVVVAARQPGAGELLVELLDVRQPAALRSSAVRGLADLGGRTAAERAIGRWDQFPVATRRELLALLLGTPGLAEIVIGALERDEIGTGELDPASREALGRLTDPQLKKRAEPFARTKDSSDRAAVIEAFLPRLEGPADAGRGAELFARNCQACHQLAGAGGAVGPDLSGVGVRPPEALLSDLLNPNGEVGPDFVGYVLVTAQGQVLSGVLVSETDAAITLRRAEGADEIVLRPQIAEFRGLGKSLMPEGFEKTLGEQGVLDVIAFLRQPRTK